MIVDQAFWYLPEVLLGSGYSRQDYEASIVGAMSLALLQELNGRNAPNPLSFLKTERLYRRDGFPLPGGDSRPLRADLFLRTDKLFVANRSLAEFGWRHRSWIEAKFFRDGVPKDKPNATAPNGTVNTASILADLIRLVVLVPEVPNKPSRSARYFLHVYDAHPQQYLSKRKNKVKASPKQFTRKWVEHLYTPGVHVLDNFQIVYESPSLLAKIGPGLADLEIVITVSNTVIRPDVDTPVHAQPYWCVLTRIVAAEVMRSKDRFVLGVDRSVKENGPGMFERIRNHVGASINPSPIKDTKPIEPEELEDIDAESPNGDAIASGPIESPNEPESS